jgi:predicted lipid-binding transport protein (Tim44 family)
MKRSLRLARDLGRAFERVFGRRDARRLLLAAAVVGVVLLTAALAAAARPGGGGSYSGGGSSSGGGGGGGGGGGDGDGELFVYLVLLSIEHPVIGIPLLLVFVGMVVLRSRARKATRGAEWTAGVSGSRAHPRHQARSHVHAALQAQILGAAGIDVAALGCGGLSREPMRSRLEALRTTDPAFSLVVFEDFLYFLYAEMHRGRGAAGMEALAPYVSDGVRAMLRGDGRIGEVNGIIIGAMTYERVAVDPSGGARVTVLVESNFVERYRPQGEQRFYVKERLTLERSPGARSRTPDKARVLHCPSCGGPLSAMRGKVCGYCNTQIDAGAKDWAITRVDLIEREQRGPLLTSNVEEKGTNLPTIFAPQARTVFAQIQAKDPAFSWQRLEQRIGLIFAEFHAGWVSRDPSRVRPFLSDNLFQSQLYWIELYRSSRCINRTDGSAISRLELANATSDAYFDAVTVRLYASGLDYTISEDGRLLSGNQKKPRAYSEYWTLIRGAQKKPTDKGDRQCPNCGAPLQINMAGNCQYCAVKVTSGEYDWVLSRIEQDEAYTG